MKKIFNKLTKKNDRFIITNFYNKKGDRFEVNEESFKSIGKVVTEKDIKGGFGKVK